MERKRIDDTDLEYIDYIKQVGAELIDWLQDPVPVDKYALNLRHKAIDVLIIFFFTLIPALFAAQFVIFFIGPEMEKSTTEFYISSTWEKFLLLVLIGPLLEEMNFRLPLRFSAETFAIAITVLSYDIISGVVFNVSMYTTGQFFWSRVFFALGIGMMFYRIICWSTVEERMRAVWSRNFKWIFIGITLWFAWMHVFNFKLNSDNLLSIPIITLPQLILGLSAGYIRMRYGFFYSFLLHGIYNAFWFLMMT